MLAMRLNHTVIQLMNVFKSFKVYVNLEEHWRYIYILTFQNDFLPSSKNIKLNGKHIIFPFKQVDVCDYNTICFVSISLMFDEIIKNLFRNKSANQHMEVVDIYFTKTEDKNISVQRVTSIYFMEERYSWNSWFCTSTLKHKKSNETIPV